MFDYFKSAHPGKSEKEIWNTLNGIRNFLKHPDPSYDLAAEVELDDQTNAAMLFVACFDCAMLCGEAMPVEVQAFNVWFPLTQLPPSTDLPGDISSLDAGEADPLEHRFPELRSASMGVRKRFGRELLRVAKTGDDLNWPPHDQTEHERRGKR